MDFKRSYMDDTNQKGIWFNEIDGFYITLSIDSQLENFCKHEFKIVLYRTWTREKNYFEVYEAADGMLNHWYLLEYFFI